MDTQDRQDKDKKREKHYKDADQVKHDSGHVG